MIYTYEGVLKLNPTNEKKNCGKQNCPPGLVFGSSSEGCDLPSHVPSCCAGQARC